MNYRRLLRTIQISILAALITFSFTAESLIIEESTIYGYNSTRLLWNQARSRKLVTLTIDDAPNRHTDEILAILGRYRVRATFFLIGDHVTRYPEIAKRIVQSGHEIGNHSYSHDYSNENTLEELKEDIRKAEKVIVETVGRIPLYFRPPGGLVNEKIKKACGNMGYSILLWDVDSRDWNLRDEDAQIVKNVMDQVRPGSVILLHSLPQTVKVLPTIIIRLLEEGYTIVPASHLFMY